MARHLGDQTVLLAASPAEPPWIDGDRWEHEARVEEATLSLARAIFGAGGRIAMAWDDALSPLVAQVAIEHQRPRRVEQRAPDDPREFAPRLVAYRSAMRAADVRQRAFGSAGPVRIHEVPRHPTDRPSRRQRDVPSRASVSSLRREMIRDSGAMAFVGLGGGAELGEITGLFAELRPRAPIFVLATTSAAAAALAGNRARAIDREILAEHAQLFAELARARRWEEPADEARHIVPYPLLAQMLVEQLDGQQRRGWQ